LTDELNLTHVDMVQEFKNKAATGTADSYMLTIARDGESPVRSIYFYDNAIDAATGYEAYQDWGFAKDFLTVELYEPTGRVHSKVLRRPRGGECVFVRQDYYDAAEIIKKLNGKIAEDQYNYLAYEFGKLFSKDNQRFNHGRFLENLGYTGEENDHH
jgi:hypothetical protein